MKNQASVSLTIVDEPINGNANTGQILIRATSDGVIAVDANGKQTPLGGQQYTINNIAADASGNFVITASDLNA